MKKVMLTFNFPIRVQRITNGEKVFVPGDGRDDVEVNLVDVDDEGSGKSPLAALHELLDGYEKELRKAKRMARPSRKF